MFTLYHYQLCPSSRFIRILLDEFKIEHITQLENYWKPQDEFLLINPAGHLPVLIDNSNFPIIGFNACVEYIRDMDLKPNIFPDDYRKKAEIYRLYHWFDTLFKKEVLDPIIYEKVFSRVIENLTPNSINLRNGMQNLVFHIRYLEHLLKDKDFLVLDTITSCDFFAAANLSVLDYLGLLNLDDYPKLKVWYFKLKSRPSFKNILKDYIVGLTPHENYKLLDI
ncbi:MAG: hypothetical protein CMN46_02360 [SAR116 cluster bacterium]|jgi:glutathione S-transferase|nr:hypothetical protein [SAR116 cluster bacterium]|tara:strand:+ start:548 stop:1216 length:669 start_codon:yes stop_codon:yes gene_type:complete